MRNPRLSIAVVVLFASAQLLPVQLSAELLSKLPEVYTNETLSKDVQEYRELVSRLPEDAQKWVLGMGQFLEDKKFDSAEKGLIAVLASKKDPLIYLTNPRIIDRVSYGDITWARRYNPIRGRYMYLDDDINELQSGRLFSGKALQELGKLLEKAENDYEIRKGLYLINNFGRPDQRAFSFRVPGFNTQLYVLGRLLGMGIPDGYERLAVAAALDYGSIYTIGDDNVRRLIAGYAHKMIKFIAETDSLFQKKDWDAKDYPLEADICLAWGATGCYYQFGNKERGTYGWGQVFKANKMNISDFKWIFVSMKTMKEMRSWMVDNHIKVRDTSKIDCDYKLYIAKFPECYDEGIDEFMVYLHDYISIGPKNVFELLDRKQHITIDGRRTPPHNLVNINWQWKRFREKGNFIGGCGDMAYVESILAKSVNISAIHGAIRYLYQDSQYGHGFCCYFNPTDGSWKTNAIQSNGIVNYAKKTLPKTLLFGWSKAYWDNISKDEYLKYSFRLSWNWWRSYILYSTNSKNVYAVGIPSGYIFRKGVIGP